MAPFCYPDERLVGPNTWETGDAYKIGWASGAIVSAIETLTKVLALHDLVADGDDWDRNYQIAKSRSDVERELRTLRTALDVLDPKATSSARTRLAKIDAAPGAVPAAALTEGAVA